MVQETLPTGPGESRAPQGTSAHSGAPILRAAEPTAADIMTRRVICAQADMTVRELTEMLRRQQISGVPVVDGDQRLVGVISIADLIGAQTGAGPQCAPAENALAESDFHTSPAMDNLAAAGGLLEPDESLWESPVAQFMSTRAITVPENTGLGQLATKLLSQRIHRLIVVAGDRIAGIVTVRDILGILQRLYASGG